MGIIEKILRRRRAMETGRSVPGPSRAMPEDAGDSRRPMPVSPIPDAPIPDAPAPPREKSEGEAPKKAAAQPDPNPAPGKAFSVPRRSVKGGSNGEIRTVPPSPRIGNRIVIRDRPVSRSALPAIDPAKITVIAPRDAWRLGMRLDPPEVRVVAAKAIKPDTPRRGRPKSTPVSEPPLETPGAASSAERRLEPLGPREELVADYIALHASVDAQILAKELKLTEVEVGASLNGLMAHGLVVRGKDALEPAPDLSPEGIPSIYNSYLAPRLERLADEAARGAWGEFIARVARGWPGRWHATQSALSWKRGRRTLLSIRLAKTQTRLCLECVEQGALPPAIGELRSVVRIEQKGGEGSKARTEIVIKGAFDAAELAGFVRPLVGPRDSAPRSAAPKKSSSRRNNG